MSTNSGASSRTSSHAVTAKAAPSRAPSSASPADPVSPADGQDRLLRIQEVAEAVGLTPRAIRYYEDVGLLKPAARSKCAYRLYDGDDLERLHYIKAMRDDAGFSLAEIGRMLEDERARTAARERLAAIGDPAERSAIHRASLARLDRQIATLRQKAERLEAMIAGVEVRRHRVEQRLAELDGGAPVRSGPRSDRAPTAPPALVRAGGSRPGRPGRPARVRA